MAIRGKAPSRRHHLADYAGDFLAHAVNTYICIPMPRSSGSSQPSWLVGLLQRILPAANPDLERFYDQIVMWHVEIEATTGEPSREVGLDAQQRVLAIGPWRENHGFIVDCGGTFVAAEYHQISEEQFEREWKSFKLPTVQ